MRPLDRDQWKDHLARAVERYPTIVTPDFSARLDDLPHKIPRTLTELRAGPTSWIDVAHLDNVLWRPDGSAVLLDWCGAAIGPPAVDLAPSHRAAYRSRGETHETCRATERACEEGCAELGDTLSVRAGRPRRGRQPGRMFLLWWKALSGSYLALTSASRR
jgi:thiamine kinase-like enzyme